MNWDPELLGAPESGAKKVYARKEYATSEKLKNWQVSRPGSRPIVPQSPTSALSTSGFQFWPLGPAEGIEGPQVTVELGPLATPLGQP